MRDGTCDEIVTETDGLNAHQAQAFTRLAIDQFELGDQRFPVVRPLLVTGDDWGAVRRHCLKCQRPEQKIAQTVEYPAAIVTFVALYRVAVTAHYGIRPESDSEATESHLLRNRIVNVLTAPMEIDEDGVRLRSSR